VNEWAFGAALADLLGACPPEAFAAASARIRAAIATEAKPPLVRLAEAANRHGVMFLSDDAFASVGMGAGSHTWPVRELPDPKAVEWAEVHDVPLVMVTGTNGKTTTVRLLAAMVAAAGWTPGFSSTDGVFVGDALLDDGDFSGPGGARSVLRDRRVEAAVLEVARGGMLRRGLGAPRADGVLVTNVGVDHLGEYGLHDIGQLADAKLVIARAVERGGTLVLNADDPVLAGRSAPDATQLVWTSRHPERTPVTEHLAGGGTAVVVEDGMFVRRSGADAAALLPVERAPVTLEGLAAYNVENVLGAVALAPLLGVSDEAIVSALASFRPVAADLPGRTNLFRFGGVTAIVDFAHNPHGMDALVSLVRQLPAGRRLVVLGQAGDRDDDSIRALARSALEMRPDHVIVKELVRYLRGREPGEVPRLIAAELEAAGSGARVSRVEGETAAVRAALEWAAPGDVLVFPIQVERGRDT
jgi:UDP-N-acetylmuramyl tripeptide synthase